MNIHLIAKFLSPPSSLCQSSKKVVRESSQLDTLPSSDTKDKRYGVPIYHIAGSFSAREVFRYLSLPVTESVKMTDFKKKKKIYCILLTCQITDKNHEQGQKPHRKGMRT